MPEIITQHPDVVKKVLESGGARCGDGLPQKILTRCPRESFCSLPGGEICVFAPQELAAMTQLKRAELCGQPSETRSEIAGPGGWLLLLALGAGAVAKRFAPVLFRSR